MRKQALTELRGLKAMASPSIQAEPTEPYTLNPKTRSRFKLAERLVLFSHMLHAPNYGL